MVMRESINYFGAISYGTISIIMIMALFSIQNIIKNKEIYFYEILGFTLLYISSLLSTLNNIYIYSVNTIYIFGDLFRLLGFGFITIGIIKWIRYDKHIKDELIKMANQDELTHILNRRSFNDKFKYEFEYAKYHNGKLSLILLDIDKFKDINDTYGHAIGDLVLQIFTSEVKSILRQNDIFARWGGDEFAILLPATGLENAIKVAKKIQQKVKSISLDTEKGKISFSVSLGIAEYRPEQKDFSKMLELADKGLYQSKSLGRDKVTTIMSN